MRKTVIATLLAGALGVGYALAQAVPVPQVAAVNATADLIQVIPGGAPTARSVYRNDHRGYAYCPGKPRRRSTALLLGRSNDHDAHIYCEYRTDDRRKRARRGRGKGIAVHHLQLDD
jgi:hypothetical protein